MIDVNMNVPCHLPDAYVFHRHKYSWANEAFYANFYIVLDFAGRGARTMYIGHTRFPRAESYI